MDDKVFTPEVIQENPFPGELLSIDSAKQTSTSGNYSPTTTRPKPFKRKVLANELLSTALNTRSRKILGEFQLGPSGSIKIGDFKEGISGDLSLTPNGITGRDIAGLTTFAIDGTSGDAVFKGHVQAGSFISGSDSGVTVGTDIGVDGADFTDIQEAVNFINDLGGGNVFIQDGIHSITSDINLYSNINLIGHDDETTILDFGGLNTARINITGASGEANNLKNIRIANLGFQRFRGNDTGAIKANYVTDLIIESCKFSGGRNYYPDSLSDLYIENSQRITINRCKFIDSLAPVNVFDNYIGSINNCYFENPRSTAIEVPGGANFIVSDNYFVGCDLECISMSGNDDGITQIINNVAEDCAQAFLIAVGVEHSVVAYNSISALFGGSNTYALIFFDTASLYNRIIGNFCRWASGGSGAGIEISDNCSRNIISENVCVSNVYGIWIDVATATKNIVTNNITYLNSTSNITDSGTTTTLANNITS